MEFMTVKEVAVMLKMTPDHIYRCVRAGAIPHYKIGRDVRITPEQVKQWLDSKRVYNKMEIDIVASTLLAANNT